MIVWQNFHLEINNQSNYEIKFLFRQDTGQHFYHHCTRIPIILPFLFIQTGHIFYYFGHRMSIPWLRTAIFRFDNPIVKAPWSD